MSMRDLTSSAYRQRHPRNQIPAWVGGAASVVERAPVAMKAVTFAGGDNARIYSELNESLPIFSVDDITFT